MKKVANKLGLNPEASEESIVEGITAVQNRADAAEKRAIAAEARANELATAQNKSIKDLEEEVSKHKDAAEKCQKELDAMKKEKEAADKKAKDAEEEASAAKAKNMVEGFAKVGKIKNDEATIKAWTDKAKIDFDGVKNLIEGLPVNKVANKIVTDPHSTEGKVVGHSAVGAMAAVQAKLAGTK